MICHVFAIHAVAFGQTVVSQIVIHIAIAHQVVVLLEAQRKGIGVGADRRHYLPVEIVEVWFAFVAVCNWVEGSSK